jgi:hypothetical protein
MSSDMPFLNGYPHPGQPCTMLWLSKRQNTVETSTFSSEFIALKTAVEMMLDVPMEGATKVFCNNESVVKNSSRPKSTLKKSHNATAYHCCREAQATGIIRIATQ